MGTVASPTSGGWPAGCADSCDAAGRALSSLGLSSSLPSAAAAVVVLPAAPWSLLCWWLAAGCVGAGSTSCCAAAASWWGLVSGGHAVAAAAVLELAGLSAAVVPSVWSGSVSSAGRLLLPRLLLLLRLWWCWLCPTRPVGLGPGVVPLLLGRCGCCSSGLNCSRATELGSP